MKRLVLLLVSLSGSAWADPSLSYQKGQSYFGDVRVAKPSIVSKETVPGYVSNDVREAKIKPHALQEEAQKRLNSPQAGSGEDVLMTSSAKRPQFVIKASDPLLTQGNEIVQNPEKFVGALREEERLPEKVIVTQHRCQTSTSMTVRVEETLVVKPVVVKRKIEVGRYWEKTRWKESRWLSGTTNPMSVRERQTLRYWFEEENWHHEFYDIYYDYQLQKGHVNQETGAFEASDWITVTKDTHDAAPEAEGHEGWQSATPGAEALVERQACHVISHTCLEGPQTKVIEGLAVFKPCWRRETVYECEGPKKNGCQHLIDRGCEQIDSKCVQTDTKRCVVFENLYECRDKHRALSKVSFKGDVPYCLDGNCAETGYAANQDMAEVLSKLAIFRELQKDMVALDAKVFKGTQDFCDKHRVGFSDCCQKAGGWGSSLKLTKCKEEELELAKKRKKGKCVYVGTFCAEKLPIVGTCIRKRSHYCCFSSKLARLVHEQGRRQLGLSFGDAEHPNCRALSIHELSNIDFSQLDLRELFADLTSKVSVPDPTKILNSFKADWEQRLPGMGEDLAEEDTMKERYKTRKKEISEKKGQYTMHHQDSHPNPKSEIASTQESKLVF